MQTINGKLINQETKKAKNIQQKIEDMSQEIQKLDPFLRQHQQDIKSTILALKYLEKRLNDIEEKPLNQISFSLNQIEQKLSKKLLTIMTISLIGVGSLWGWFILKNQDSSCQSNLKTIQLVNNKNA
jgi:Mg2+ and Co2+ transporter CorA